MSAVEGADAAAGEETPAVEPETLHGWPVSSSRGQRVVHPDRAGYLDLLRALADEGFGVVADLTAVDYLTFAGSRDLPDGVAPQRFEVVVNLLKMDPPERLRVRVQIPASDPSLVSAWSLHPSVEAAEREVFDLFGIEFPGHPDLTRIIMPEDWDGHPLRKDFSVGRIPVQFKGAPATR